jgi:adenylate cyclase
MSVPDLNTLPRVEPSEEIRRIAERWTRAVTEGDHESALARLSELPGTLIIGNDPNEWWHGKEARAIWARQLEELGSFPVTSYEVEAWEEGTVGWASVKETITSSGASFDGRATYVLHLERGEWKVVQVHWSLPKPNVEFLGRALTTSLEELELAVQREKPDLSATLDSEGTVTIVFTDIVDSTVLLSRLADYAWRDLLRRHNAVIEGAPRIIGAPSSRRRATGRCSPFRAPDGRSRARRRSSRRSLRHSQMTRLQSASESAFTPAMR